MSWRRALRTVVLLLPVALGVVAAWQLSARWPEALRRIEGEIRAAAASRGITVAWKSLRLRILLLRVSLEGVEVGDAAARLPLLTARHVDLSLSPLKLLTGELPVSRVRLRGAELTFRDANLPLVRRLAGSTGEDAGPVPEILVLESRVRLGPLAPVEGATARIRELRVRDTRFLGTRVTGVVDGAEGRIRLPSGAEVAVPPLSVTADLFLAGKEVRFRRFAFSGGGAAVRLSGRLDPAGGGNDLKGSGEVDLARWISGGAPFSSLASRVATEGKVSFSASLKGSLGEPVGEGRLVLAGGRLALPARAPAGGSGTAASGEATVSYREGTVRLPSSRWNLWGGTLAGEGSYDLRAGRGSAKVTASSLAAAELPLPPDFPARLLGRAGVSLSAEGSAERLAWRIAADASGGIELPPADGRGPAPRLPGPLSAELAGTASPQARSAVLESGRISAPLLSVTASGSADLRRENLSLAAEARSPGGSLKDLSLPGRLSWREARLRVSAEGPFRDPFLRGNLGAEALALPPLPPVPLSARFEGTVARALHFVADVAGGPLPATATGTFSAPPPGEGPAPLLEASVTVRDGDLSELSRALPPILAEAGAGEVRLPSLSGRASAEVNLEVAGDAVAVEGALRSREVRADTVVVEDLSAEGSWSRKGSAPASWRGRAGVRVAGGGLEGRGESRDGRWSASASWAGVDAGSAALVAGWGWGGARLSGPGDGRVEVAGSAAGWTVPSLHASFPELVVGDTPVSGVTVDGTVGREEGRLSLRCADPALELVGTLRREGEWPVSVEAKASSLTTSALAGLAGAKGGTGLEGTWTGEGSARVLLRRLAAGRGDPWAAVPSFRLRVSADGPSAAGLSFGRLDLEGRKEGSRILVSLGSRDPEGHLEGSLSLEPPYLFRLAGPFAAGEEGGVRRDELSLSVAGRVDVSGALGDLRRTEGSLVLDRFRVRAGEIDVSGKGVPFQMDGTGVRVTGGTVLAEGNPLALSGRLSWKGDVDARLEGKMPVGVVRLLVPGVFDRLDGVGTFDLRVRGGWRSPDLVGSARLEGGTLSFAGYNQVFEELKAEATLTKERVVLERFSGRSGGGYLDGHGELPLSDSPAERMSLSVDFVDMRYPYPADLAPVLDGHVEIYGPYSDFVVSGDVSVRSALYSRPVRLQKAILEMRRRLEEVSARREKGSFTVRLDLNCVVDGTLRIRNDLADATARGEFKLVGDVFNPVLLGSFDVLEGVLMFQGNRYTVRRLSLEFNDPRRNNPRIDGAAEVRKDDVLVTVLVTGTLEKYEVDFVSEPPLGKNDILSLLTLGVRTSSLEGKEGSVGASAASSLALSPYTGRVEDELRGVVGLDRFAVEAAYSSSTQTFEPRFVVGKSFGERLTLSVSTLVGTVSETTAMAEVRLLENVYLQGAWESATTTRQGDLGADLKFRYRYRSFRDVFRRGE